MHFFSYALIFFSYALGHTVCPVGNHCPSRCFRCRTSYPVLGVCTLVVDIGFKFPFKQSFIVASIPNAPFVLGLDFVMGYKVSINLRNVSLRCGRETVKLSGKVCNLSSCVF